MDIKTTCFFFQVELLTFLQDLLLFILPSDLHLLLQLDVRADISCPAGIQLSLCACFTAGTADGESVTCRCRQSLPPPPSFFISEPHFMMAGILNHWEASGTGEMRADLDPIRGSVCLNHPSSALVEALRSAGSVFLFAIISKLLHVEEKKHFFFFS